MSTKLQITEKDLAKYIDDWFSDVHVSIIVNDSYKRDKFWCKNPVATKIKEKLRNYKRWKTKPRRIPPVNVKPLYSKDLQPKTNKQPEFKNITEYKQIHQEKLKKKKSIKEIVKEMDVDFDRL